MKRTKLNSESGFIIVFFVLVIVPLIGMLALIVDGARIISSKSEQEANAEYAALAAMEEFKFCIDEQLLSYNVCKSNSINKAELSGGLNKYVASNKNSSEVDANGLSGGSQGSVKFGIFNGTTFQENTDPNFINAVKVNLNTLDNNAFQTIFSKIVGYRRFNSKSSAIVYYDSIRASNMINPFLVYKM